MKFKIHYQNNSQLKTKIITKNDTFPKNIVKIKQIKNIHSYFDIEFYSYDEVVNVFKELNMILQTDISLGEAIDILLQSNQNKKTYEILNTIQQAINNAQPIDLALIKHKNYLKLLPLLFFKLANQNGNIKDSINALSMILIENQKAKKKILKALSYPIVLSFTLLLSFIFVFSFVIPNFEHIFMQFGSTLPYATKSLLWTKAFFSKFYVLFLFFCISFLFSSKYLYLKNKYFFDKLIVIHIPIISKLYTKFMLYRFLLSLKMIVKSHHQFQVALENAKLVVYNEFLVNKINKIISDIKNGYKIADAFENSFIFNTLTIRLLNTAQQTNTIPQTLSNITNTYKQSLDDDIDKFSKAISPIFILIISTFILWLIFALMLPVWDLGRVLN